MRDNNDPKLGNNNKLLVVALFSTAEFRKPAGYGFQIGMLK